MQPTMIEMMVEEQQRELDRQRNFNRHVHELKRSRKPYRERLAQLFKHAE